MHRARFQRAKLYAANAWVKFKNLFLVRRPPAKPLLQSSLFLSISTTRSCRKNRTSATIAFRHQSLSLLSPPRVWNRSNCGTRQIAWFFAPENRPENRREVGKHDVRATVTRRRADTGEESQECMVMPVKIEDSNECTLPAGHAMHHE